MKYAVVLVAVAGLAAAARANTSINFESSVDGSNWSATRSVIPGATVYIRMRVQLSGATALGFAGLVSQPVLSNWTSGDVRNAFTFPGLGNDGTPGTETAYDGRMVSNAPGTNTGRIFPFGTAGQGAASSSGLLTSFVDPGNRLRFAGSKNSTETTNVVWGVVSAQNPLSLMGTNFSTSTNVVVFRYGITIDPASSIDRQLNASVVNIAAGSVKWYLNSSGTSVLNDPIITVNEGSILLTAPAPGAVALLGFSAAAAGRRRRRD